MIDENELRKEVYSRHHDLKVTVSHSTPSGRRRYVPVLQTTIENKFLKERRVLQGHSNEELLEKARKIIERWNTAEIKARLGTVVKDIHDSVEKIESILVDGLASNPGFDWRTRLSNEEFPAFRWDVARPPKPTEPLPHFLEFIFTSWRREREELWAKTLGEWDSQVKQWESEREAAKAEHERHKTESEEKQQERNLKVLDFIARLESGDPEAVVEHIQVSLESRPYPDCFPRAYEAHLHEVDRTLVIDVSLPRQQDLPDVLEMKYSGHEFKHTKMKKSAHDALYDSAIKQCALRTIFEVFACSPESVVESVVFNGWVTSTIESTGNDETACIISLSAERKKFAALNLKKADPSKCIASLKGLVAGPLSQLAPVKPILQLQRTDSRFIASRDVLDAYDTSTNLAEIPWEEFEQLVRELFGKLFSSDGSEVRVTQASRDGGVDAVAFDPDPIRGGKFVIQAKRYTNVVGVSAVRDLYGTMINEGAAKGILVTTSHFGSDSREFAKDKPITLIDGANLVFLLEQNGKKVRIDIDAAKRHRNTGPTQSPKAD